MIMNSIIGKLPPSSKDFKRSLKHRKEDISLDNLANHLHVEEEFRMQEEKKEPGSHVSKVHAVKEGQSSRSSYKKKGVKPMIIMPKRTEGRKEVGNASFVTRKDASSSSASCSRRKRTSHCN